MSELRLHTVLIGRGPAAAIVLSDEQVASLGAGKVFPVAVTIGGRTARLRLARMGGENLIGFTKAVRADLGLEAGQEIDAVIRVDSAERTVDVPAELAAALDADPAVRRLRRPQLLRPQGARPDGGRREAGRDARASDREDRRGAARLTGQRFSKAGVLFSRNAAMPSF
ncbi:hypothetical protein GCM10010458_30870 [Microbacterium luteolum]|uniref:DUF1905 domain-containing protein n=1 Tax=Microbacterium luteolum TaxID=69367 RepID=UPI00249C83AD|nr:DUF1905 domain-containing protein [Microbacterium luteolum]